MQPSDQDLLDDEFPPDNFSISSEEPLPKQVQHLKRNKHDLNAVSSTDDLLKHSFKHSKRDAPHAPLKSLSIESVSASELCESLLVRYFTF